MVVVQCTNVAWVQVIGMVEERLSLNEDKMATLEQRVTAAVDERLSMQEARIKQLISRLESDAKPVEHPRWTKSTIEEELDSQVAAGVTD